MNPEIQQLKNEIQNLRAEVFKNNFSSIKVENKKYQFNREVGFFGTKPIVQGATIADPTGGGTQDAEARTAINDLIDRLQDLGLIA